MRVNVVRVNSEKSYGHPYDRHQKVRAAVSVEATIDPGEDWEKVTRTLHRRAFLILEAESRMERDYLRDTEDAKAEMDFLVKATGDPAPTLASGGGGTAVGEDD